MKIFIVSDTHGEIEKTAELIKKDKYDAIIHLGDHALDAKELKEIFPYTPMYNVKGNCDYDYDVRESSLIQIGGKRIFMTHGHLYRVDWGTDRLIYAAMEKAADVCLFGHTHVPLLELRDDIIFLNPGSPSRPRGGSIASYAVLTIEEKNNIKAEINCFGNGFVQTTNSIRR
ncbi:MAG: metallophosphoesterase [Firmicutes bacterium]|nr:metallophosphoesterase [Bacillota bacterium]